MNDGHSLIKKDLCLVAATAVLATVVARGAWQLLQAHPAEPFADAALWWLGVLVGFPLSVAVHGLLGWLIGSVVARLRNR